MSKLVLMQHYGLGTRCLDVSENPLAALYFACVPCKKFARPGVDEAKEWGGEVVVFRETEESVGQHPERLKTVESSNVSILANTAFMENEFSLWHLGSFWKKDANQTYNEKYLNLKSIVRDSFIVRVPQNNPRIRNQKGAFIIVNANQVCRVCADKKQETADMLTRYIVGSDYVDYTELLEHSAFGKKLDREKTWELRFRKINPCSGKNKIEAFNTDPFDLKKMLYRDGNGNQLVALVPPEAKEKLVADLALFGITEDYVYPDMDTVANEINLNINCR